MRRSLIPSLMAFALLLSALPALAQETIQEADKTVYKKKTVIDFSDVTIEGDARLAAGEKIAAIFREQRTDATPDQIEFERKRLARAPLVIAVVSRAGPHVKIPEWEQELSAGAASMSLVIAAHAMGYAASWITEWYAYDRRVLDALGLAANERVAGFVHIGRPAKPPEDRERPKLGDIVTRYSAPTN